MQITTGDLSDPRVIDLLHYHLTSSRAQTAPRSAHALDLKGLQSPDINFWTAWNGEGLVAVGALKQLSKDHGEVNAYRDGLAQKGHCQRYAAPYNLFCAIARNVAFESGDWLLGLFPTCGSAVSESWVH